MLDPLGSRKPFSDNAAGQAAGPGNAVPPTVPAPSVVGFADDEQSDAFERAVLGSDPRNPVKTFGRRSASFEARYCRVDLRRCGIVRFAILVMWHDLPSVSFGRAPMAGEDRIHSSRSHRFNGRSISRPRTAWLPSVFLDMS